MTRTMFVRAATVATLSFGAVATAQAQNTVLNFNGSANIQDPNPAPNAGNTLLLDFLLNGTTAGATPGTVRAVEQTDLIGVTSGVTQGAITDMTVDGSGFVGTPQTFVTIGGYTFTLTGSDNSTGNTFGPISLFQQGRNTFATFNVNGTVAGPGLNAGSTFFGSFSTQFNNITPNALFSRIDRGVITNASFSATFNIAQNVVPEPSTYALMGSGVAMLGFFARRRRTQA